MCIVLPAHNEEDALPAAVETVQDWSYTVDRPVTIIIVEDGCTDRTPEISTELAEQHDNVTHIHAEERLGKGTAVENGFNAADADILCFMDVDLSTHVDHLGDLLEPIEQGTADITIGSRYLAESETDRDPARHLMSRGYNTAVRILFRTGVADHQCGFKAMRRQVFDTIRSDIEATGWFWDTELITTAQNHGFDVIEVPVRWVEDRDSAVDILPAAAELGRGLIRLKSEQLFGNRAPLIQQYIVFAVIGAFGALLNTAVLYAVTEFFGLHYLVSAVIATEAAIIAMFFLNNQFTFSSGKEGIRQIADGIIRSNIVRSGGIAVQLGLLYALTEFASIYYILSNILAITIASIITFIGEKKFNWKE